MAGPAKAPQRLFVAGCFLLVLAVVLGWASMALEAQADTRTALIGLLYEISMYAIVVGAVSTLLGCILLCVFGDPRTIQILGTLAALGGILCVSANLHGFNVHSGPGLYAIVGVFVVFLGASMAFVGWIRSRPQRN